MRGGIAVVTLRLRGADAVLARGISEPVFRWLELRLHLDEGADRGRDVLAVGRDVTATKRHEEEMEAARQAAEQASVAKDHFLANVSHELRTPLNAIIGFSEMLCSAQIGPIKAEKSREYADIIRQSGHHLLSVVNSLLDMSKIQAGSFELQPESFAVAPLVDLCCDMIKLKAEDGGVELMRIYPDTLEELVGDKRACKQIVLNLLSNAVKFTPRGGRVTIGARPEGNYLLMQVADTGIGIHAGDLGRLGDAFFQARTGVDRPFEGTGARPVGGARPRRSPWRNDRHRERTGPRDGGHRASAARLRPSSGKPRVGPDRNLAAALAPRRHRPLQEHEGAQSCLTRPIEASCVPTHAQSAVPNPPRRRVGRPPPRCASRTVRPG